jgi:DNA (cytosine-5)-methyltransferase 1
MNVLDLFSGIGGFSLGLERAGMRTVAFCEIEPFCRAVLKKHWPHVPCYDDIRTLTAERLAADRVVPDVICGGFPCQDISSAGLGAGIEGGRSGLWSEYARLVGEIRPRYVIVENVAALLGRGLSRVLGDLASIGFDAEWHCIPASAVGAPHRRDRLWLVANPGSGRRRGPAGGEDQQPGRTEVVGTSEDVADAARVQPGRQEQWAERQRTWPSGEPRDGADAETTERWRSDGEDDQGRWDTQVRRLGLCGHWSEHWLVEPDVGRVAHGVSARVDRLKGLGNAVVPQIPEIIGRAIIEAERTQIAK